MQRKLLVTLVLLILVSLVGSSVALAQDDPTQRTRAERAEIRFLEGMIDHHQMALDMAADCLVKAETEAVRTLCQNVITAQSGEILTMRGWLLAWYHIDYTPMSMMAMQGGDPGMGMGMGMMGSDMMAQMMEMMMGMMANGMGMMGGMSGGQGMPDDMTNMTNDLPMIQMMSILYALQTVTLGELLDMTADVDPTTPFIQVLQHHVENMMTDATAGMMPTLDDMTMGQMMVIFAQLQSLTLADVQAMVGHLDDAASQTLLELVQHHLETTLNAPSSDPAGGEHATHHPTGDTSGQNPAATADAGTGMDGMDGMESMEEGDTTNPAGGMGFVDPAMGMGMFAGFGYLTGVDYEIAWLEAMIDHHDDALQMSNRILEQAVHAELATFAQGIIDAQTAEIAAMEALLVELGGA